MPPPFPRARGDKDLKGAERIKRKSCVCRGECQTSTSLVKVAKEGRWKKGRGRRS